MKHLIGIGVLSVALFFGCKTDNAEIDMGYDFYPATIGSWISYEVDSIRHSTGASTDTFRYQIKELVESAFIDEAGRQARRLERYYRDSTGHNWNIKDIWMVAITSRKVEKTEENVRFVRLNFPVKAGQYWDGNSLNDMDPWDYSYESVGETAQSGDAFFDNTAIVVQQGAVNLIEQERGKEIYARHIGLVYKELFEIKTDINYMANPVAENIQSGYELYYRYLDHGQN